MCEGDKVRNSGNHQDLTVPIAIVGLAFQFPDDAKDAESFWAMLLEKRCASKEFPKDRLNGHALYHPDRSRGDSVSANKTLQHGSPNDVDTASWRKFHRPGLRSLRCPLLLHLGFRG
jgi:hypothetical protein